MTASGRRRRVIGRSGTARTDDLSARPVTTLTVDETPPVGLCPFSCFPVVVVARPSALRPDHRPPIGRSVTAVNLARMTGSAALPVLVGAAADLSPEPDGGVARAKIAYCAACVMLAAALGLARIGNLLPAVTAADWGGA